MTDQTHEVPRERRKGDRRGGGRRKGDSAFFRRPSAIQAAAAGLGLILVIAIVMTMTGDDEEAEPRIFATGEAAQPDIPVTPAHPAGAIREIYSAADFEALLAEGDAAVGQTIRTELYCGSISQVTVRTVEPMNPSIMRLAGNDGRLAATECSWSTESTSSDLLLVVPPQLAEDLARAPEVEINFVTRRRVPAEIEWLGRSGELALRNAAILRLVII